MDARQAIRTPPPVLLLLLSPGSWPLLRGQAHRVVAVEAALATHHVPHLRAARL